MMLPKSSLLGLPITQSSSVNQTLDLIKGSLAERESCIISFINPSAFNLRLEDQAYANALWYFDLILPDGIGVTIAARWINRLTVERQSFDETSLFAPVMSYLNESKRSLCIIGSKPGVAAHALLKMKNRFPQITYLGVMDGYQPFDEAVAWAKAKNPDVILVGMGAPLQESFLLRLRHEGFNGVGITCGGFLDQYSMVGRYYPRWVDQLELRWLYRLLMEPKRLGKRYFIEYQAFVSDMLSALSNQAINRKDHSTHLWLARRYARTDRP